MGVKECPEGSHHHLVVNHQMCHYLLNCIAEKIAVSSDCWLRIKKRDAMNQKIGMVREAKIKFLVKNENFWSAWPLTVRFQKYVEKSVSYCLSASIVCLVVLLPTSKCFLGFYLLCCIRRFPLVFCRYFSLIFLHHII